MTTETENDNGRGLRVGSSGKGARVRYDGASLRLPDDETARRAAMMILSQVDGGSILLDAYQVGRRRGEQYGPPGENFEVASGLFDAYLGTDTDPSDFAIAMVLAKVARIRTGGMDREHLVDIAGYARAAAVVEGINDQ